MVLFVELGGYPKGNDEILPGAGSPGKKMNCHELSQALWSPGHSWGSCGIYSFERSQWQLETSSFFPSALGLLTLCCHKALLNIAVPF